jgi:hypothetical protein
MPSGIVVAASSAPTMTRADWLARAFGGALFMAACAITRLDPHPSGPGAAVAGFVLSLTGVIFLLQGKRVLLAWRIECSRHRELPRLLHARRLRGRGERGGG